MDPHPLADRAQPATHPEPAMAGRDPGHGRHRRGGEPPEAGRRASRRGRAGSKGSSSAEGRGGAQESRGRPAQASNKRKRQRHATTRDLNIHSIEWLRWSRRSDRARRQPQRLNERPCWQRHRARAARSGSRARDRMSARLDHAPSDTTEIPNATVCHSSFSPDARCVSSGSPQLLDKTRRNLNNTLT